MSNPYAPLLRLLRLNRDDKVAVGLAVGRPMTGISGVAKQQQRRLTKPQQAELVERYRSGDLMTELARRFEIDRRTVSAILKRHEVPTRPQGLSVKQVQDAVLMYAQGKSLAVIGSKLGVNTRTVHNRLRDQRVQMRDTRGRK